MAYTSMGILLPSVVWSLIDQEQRIYIFVVADWRFVADESGIREDVREEPGVWNIRLRRNDICIRRKLPCTALHPHLPHNNVDIQLACSMYPESFPSLNTAFTPSTA